MKATIKYISSMRIAHAFSIFAILVFCQLSVFASGTKIGNGDNGSDLEESEEIKSGILQETRLKAVAKLKSLNTASIQHLGALMPELENTKLFFVKEDKISQYKMDQGMESSQDGSYIYARTMPTPHAATRFFPAALRLSEEQLVALHVHEALHRALPSHVSENEEVVTRITLAITSPGATNDSIRAIVDKQIQAPSNSPINRDLVPSHSGNKGDLEPELKYPSSVSYHFYVFENDTQNGLTPVRNMHSVKSYLHPFGYGPRAVGLGLELSYLNLEGQSIMGPLGISGRMRVMTFRGFDIDSWGLISISTAEPNELHQSHVGTDNVTVGLSMKKISKIFYVENSISITGGTSSTQRISGFDYEHHFGQVVKAKVSSGLDLGVFDIGAYADLALADSYSLTGPGMQDDDSIRRFRILSVGPEAGYRFDDLRLSLYGKWIVDKSDSVNFDYLGDILGAGAGHGYVGSSLTVRF